MKTILPPRCRYFSDKAEDSVRASRKAHSHQKTHVLR